MLDIIISGKVIKVGFRFGAMEQAYKDWCDRVRKVSKE